MHSHSYLNSAVKIINDYAGEEPLSAFLKKYFLANKKFGSRDRKQVAHLCYCFFRLGKALTGIPVEDRILIGLFLSSSESNNILQEIKPEWNSQVEAPISEKLSIIHARSGQSGGNSSSVINHVFPWSGQLSEGVDHEKFCESFFVQPNLYLRIRPGHDQAVKDKLVSAGIGFIEIQPGCLSLPNATRIESIIDLDREAVVQDLSSQQIGKYLHLLPDSYRNAQCLPMTIGVPIAAWDCCAGSGGKSLLLHDVLPNLDLTVSDVRESILANLKKRFANAGITKYHSFIADLTNSHSPFTIHHSQFDLIICDAPCTGSGTWSRTPEQVYFFDEKKIHQYASLQRRIVTNVIPHLKPGGILVYITCSVFKNENERVVHFIQQQSHMHLIEMKLLSGYENRADTMFVSIFRNDL